MTTFNLICLAIAIISIIASFMVCIIKSFRFDERAMDIKNHISNLLRHEHMLKILLREIQLEEDDKEWKDEVDKEMYYIHDNAIHIKNTLNDKM